MWETFVYALARVPNPPHLLDEVFRLRRVTSFQQRKEVTKKRRPDVCADQSLTRLIGPLRFSDKVGFLDRPSLACLKTLRHPCLARVCARLIHLGLQGSAQPDGGNIKSHGNIKSTRSPVFNPLSPRTWGEG